LCELEWRSKKICRPGEGGQKRTQGGEKHKNWGKEHKKRGGVSFCLQKTDSLGAADLGRTKATERNPRGPKGGSSKEEEKRTRITEKEFVESKGKRELNEIGEEDKEARRGLSNKETAGRGGRFILLLSYKERGGPRVFFITKGRTSLGGEGEKVL